MVKYFKILSRTNYYISLFMCLIVFSYKSHPHYDLIFAANRDEFYERPTRPAQFWDNHPDILAGKDLTAGGTWMGINKRGQFAALTNYRDPSIMRDNPPSRGQIVLDYLARQTPPEPFLQSLQSRAPSYMGFNVLTGTPRTLLHYSNVHKKITRVEPGIHGLSNHLLDTPWPKVQQSKQELEALIQDNNFNEDALFRILKNDQPAPENALPDTGIPEELEKQISPIFIKTDKYGTRSSTILLIDKKRNVTFEERRYDDATDSFASPARFEFTISD